MARVLITGATGFIGGALARRLREERAHEVISPTRAALDLQRGDIELPQGIDVLVHCAASRERGDPSPSRMAEETSINVTATARLYDRARAQGVPTIVHLSTISVLRPRQDPDALLDEDSPRVEAPTHPYALTKRWAEELVFQLRGSFRAIAIVRPGMVYGRSMSKNGSLARIAASLGEGERYRMGRPDGDRHAPVYIDDVVDVLARLLANPSNLLVNVSGPDAITERSMIDDMASCLDRRVSFEETDEPVASVATSTARVDALFPDRIRTPWKVGAPRSFGDNQAGCSREMSSPNDS